MRYNCAMIDVDNTLFDFATPLYKIFTEAGIDLPGPQIGISGIIFIPNS